MKQLHQVLICAVNAYIHWIGCLLVQAAMKVLDAIGLFLVRIIGPKSVQWIAKHFPWSQVNWLLSFVPRNFVFWRNFMAITGVAIMTWNAHTLLGCNQTDKMHVKWNITSELPLSRRLVYDNGLGQKPPMGWSSWNHFECKINEKIVRENTEALVQLGLPALGYNYVVVDDCWAAYKRDKQGNLKSDPRTFPSGMKALADHAHERGLRFGLYSDCGKRTCIGHRAGSQGHEIADAKTFALWGVDYLKYDNCFHDGAPAHIRYPVMSEALNKSGRPIFYAICEWGDEHPAVWASKYANSWRTSLDSKDRWKRVQLLADDNNMWASYAGPGGWNDPDMLQVGNGRLSLTEYRSHFSIWSIMKAPLFMGCDLRTVSKEHIEIYTNTEIIAVNQDSLGIQGRKVSRQGRCNCREVWAGPLSGKRIVVVVWNRDWMRASIKVNWYDLGLEPDVSVRIRDLWKHEDWPHRVRDGFEVELASHDCGMYIMSDIRQTPANLH